MLPAGTYNSSPITHFSYLTEQCLYLFLGFPGGSDDKKSAYNSETQVQCQGQEDPLEKKMTTCSSILAWRILWTEESGRLQPMGLQRVGHD